MPKSTFGQMAADVVASTVGSWPFVIIQSLFLAFWVVINTVAAFKGIAWDREPYILLNLMLSFQAAYTGPIVMISQNRAEQNQREMLYTILLLSKATQELLKERAWINSSTDSSPELS